MGTNKPQLKTYIDENLKRKFSHIAKLDHRSDSNYLEYVISKHIEEYEAEHGELIIDEEGNILLAKPTDLEGRLSSSKIG